MTVPLSGTSREFRVSKARPATVVCPEPHEPEALYWSTGATQVATSSQTFFYHPTTKSFSPSGFTGPVDEEDAEVVANGQVPLEVYFSCKRLINAGTVIYYHPKITIEPAATPVFHQKVAPALSFRPVIGPGPLRKVLGAH